LLAELSQNQTLIEDLRNKPQQIDHEDIQLLPKISEEELESLKHDHEQERNRLQALQQDLETQL
jgi:hypothetical protein